MYFANSSENKHAYETSSFPPMIHQMDRREMAGDVTLADWTRVRTPVQSACVSFTQLLPSSVSY